MTAPLPFLLAVIAAAQLPPTPVVIAGEVRDATSSAPVRAATVTDLATGMRSLTDSAGRFTITMSLPGRIRVVHPAFAAREIAVATPGPLTVELAPAPRALERTIVTAIRGGSAEGTAPVAQHTMTRSEIERAYFGQDAPLLLRATPSLTSYSETGSYWGYSYIRLRGIDQSRINITIDGIPLNDPEDQVLYFADFPDLANSIESVQIQRGVGTSTTGTASFGGSVNFETIPLATTAQRTEVQVDAGSFASRRASAEYHSGLTSRHLALYARLSTLRTNGYREHSGVSGRSAFVSAGWFGARDIVKVMATAGIMRDTLSYLAVPETALVRDRRLNPLQPDERDRFGEQLASVAYTRSLSTSSSWSTTAYRISASGNYDVAYAPDFYTYHLDFVWYGLTSAYSWTGMHARANLGVNANTYARDHYAFLQPDPVALYRNTGHKRDASAFAKGAADVGPLTLFGDVQLRTARFEYEPDAAANLARHDASWSFANPKVGLSLQATSALRLFASVGQTQREPARSDIFAGADNLDSAGYAAIGDFSRVRPERVRDLEVGAELVRSDYRIGANAFDMSFRNEIAPIGVLSDLGTPLRKNVPRSYRRGIELDGRWNPVPIVALSGNLTLMRARIDEYVDEAYGGTYHDVPPLQTPSVQSSQRIDVAPPRGIGLSAEGRYVGRSQLDNTGDAQMILPASYVVDLSATYRLGRAANDGVVIRLNNAFGSDGYGGGYPGEVPYYYVLPPRNWFVGLTLAW